MLELFFLGSVEASDETLNTDVANDRQQCRQ